MRLPLAKGLFVLMGLVLPSAFAQENAPPPQLPAQNPEPGKKEKVDDPLPLPPDLHQRLKAQASRPGFRHDDIVNRRLAAFTRLHEMLVSTIKFEADRRKKIDRIFDDYLAGLLDPKSRPHVQPLPKDMAVPQQLPELEAQLAEAEKSGDRARIEEAKRKIYSARIALEPNIVDEPHFFFDYLAAELNDEEKAKFLPIMERWRLLRVAEVAPDNDFKHLLRAARDPELGLSEEKTKELRVMLIEAMRTVPFPQRNDQPVMTELAEKTKPKVLEQLDAKQKDHYQQTVSMLARWQKEDDELAQKVRERLKNYIVSSTEAPTGGKSEAKPATPAKPASEP